MSKKSSTTTVRREPPFDPHACFKALTAAYDHLQEALGVLPMEGNRHQIHVAKVNIGSLMAALLEFMLDDDNDEAGIEDEASEADGIEGEASEADGPSGAVITKIGPNKINVIKAVRESMNLGLMEAVDLVKGPVPVVIFDNRAAAESFKKKLEAAGATVEVRSMQPRTGAPQSRGDVHPPPARRRHAG